MKSVLFTPTLKVRKIKLKEVRYLPTVVPGGLPNGEGVLLGMHEDVSRDRKTQRKSNKFQLSSPGISLWG